MKIKNRTYSRVAALLMVFIMLFTMIPPMAFAGTSENVPFTATVNGETMTDVTESSLTWTSWDGTTSDILCYTVAVPEEATEAILTFETEKQWSYYDSKGNYVGEGDTSWTSLTEHTVAIADSNSDGELDGISVQIPGEYSTELYILFKYVEAKTETPFLSVKIGDEEVEGENIINKGIFSLGDYAADEQQGEEDYYDYVHKVPYYHVTVPCGTESVDVTYSEDTNILNDGSNAYGYKTDLEIDAMTSATVKSNTFKNAYTVNTDGTQTVKTPVTGFTFDADGNGHAVTLESDGGTYPAICLFSFVYDGVNHVYVDGVCSCGAEDPAANEPEGAVIPDGAPFTAIATNNGEPSKITQKDNVTYTGYSTYENIPYYHVTIPAGATEVYVTHPSSEDPFADASYGSAYGYAAETSGWTGSGTNFSFEAADDGYKIILPLSVMVDTDGDWSADTEGSFVADTDGNVGYAVAVERNDFSPICFFTFEYAEAEEGEHVHSYDAGVVTTPATCVEAGAKTFTCAGCSEETEGHSYTEAIPATGHSYDDGEITTPATCAAAGVKTFTCGNCSEGTEGHSYTESVPATGHSYDEGVVTTAPTCTEAGVKTFTCQTEGCTDETAGHTKTEAVAKLGHDYDNEERKCPRCGDVAPAQNEHGVYQLGTAEELLWFANKVNSGENTSAKAALIADIELDAEWPGIGVYGNAYAGAFDGQNHKVTLNNSTWGVFGYVMGTHNNHALKDAAVIENVIVEGTAKNSALIHSAGYARVTNCINKAEITSENSKVAGIVGSVSGSNKYGQIYSDVMIQNCANEGNIKGDNNIGGILGYSQAKATLDGCYNTGSVEGSSNVGGLVGYMQGSTGKGVIQNSFNKGTITGTSCVAGIIGNMYNGVSITNCYNAGEATYAIAGNIYNNTASITNTYYRGNLCTYSVPDVTQNAGYYSGNRGIAMTSAEMSSEELAALLGDVFKQSCPSPVLSYQETSDHVIENNVCQICKQGNDMPEEFAVTFAAATGSEIVGDTTFRKGNSYTFSVNVLAGYYATEDFAVYVNGTKVEAVDGLYTVSEPDGPFYISTSGVKEEEGILPIVLPGAGEGYRVNPCDGYGVTVERGKDYKFTVSFVEGFAAGEDFLVKANGLIVKADGNGVYTLENITLQQNITVEGVDVVPSGNTVAVKVDFTKGDYTFLASEETDTIMMDKTFEIPYFDIALYDLEKYYYNPYCYLDENGNIRGQQKAGTRESAYDVVTSMHAFIYMTEVYYLGYDPEDAGKGFSCLEDTDDDGISDFDEAVSWTQNVGSTFMDLWGQGTNLNYHVNYEYPIAYPGWGSTSDQQALVDGDLVVIHLITGSASGSAFGVFVVNDNNDTYDRTDERDEATVKQGESITLTHYLGTQGDHYTTNFIKAVDKGLEWIEEGNETADIREWNTDTGFGTIAEENFKTDENGQITIDTTGVEPGVYYIGAAGGFEKGSGVAGSDGFVSSGSEAGPSYFKLTVEEADHEEDTLAEAKEAAKKDIAGYKDADNYRDAQKAELEAAIEAGNSAIEAAEDVDAVAAAVSEAKAEMDKIKTDAQLKAEELTVAKTSAKKEIAGYKDAADYRDAQKAELEAAIEAADAAIEAAEDVDAVAAAVSAAKAEMDKIKTDAQLKAEELAAAKTSAKAEIADYKDAADYRAGQKVELAAAIEAGNAAIEASETIDAVEAAVSTAKAEMDKIKTDAQLKAEEDQAKAEAEAKALAEAKEAAKKDIAGYKDAADYRDAQKAELEAAIEAGNAAIEAAEDVDAVAAAVSTAKAEMDKIKTDVQLKAEEEAAKTEATAKALAEAKAVAKKTVAGYKNAADYRDAQKAELTAAIEAANKAIDAAESVEAVEQAVANAKTTMDSIKTDAQLKAEEEANKPEADEPTDKPADTPETDEPVATVKLKTPSNVKATNVAKTGKVKLTWTKVTGAEKYKIYRATSKNGKYTYMNTVTGTSYINKTAKAGTTYYYKVKAVSGDKNVTDSAFSKIVKRTCDLARPIVKASNVAKTGKVKLTWTKVAGAEKYKIYRATSKNGKYTYMNTVTGTSYINKTAKAGKTYYYKVKAIDADNSAANSAFSTVDKRTCDLARPDVTVKSKTKKQVKLTWKKVTNAKKYVVYRATSKNGKYTKIATTTKLSFTNKKLKSGKTYYYKVKAISKNSAANSAFSTVDKCKVK